MVPEITAAFSQSIIGGRKILWRNYLTEKISSSGTPNHLKRNLEEARLKLQVQDNKFFRFNQI
jgi:hypothetical protein